MRALIQGLCVFLAAATCWLSAQVLEEQPRGSEANQTVSGTVVNSVTGEPIRRALVSFGGQYSMLTDGDGHFEFRNLPQIQAFISVRKPGFFSQEEVAQGQPPENLVVQAGQNPPPLVAKLIPEGIIFGHIESDGGPVEGIPVRVIASRIREGRKRWEPQGIVLTDEEGGFRIANLMPGSYYLSVGPTWDPAMTALGNPPRQRGYPELFYPGVPEIDAATPLEITPGEQVEADISAKLVPMYDISGTITGFTPGTGIGLDFATASGEEATFDTHFDDETGNFRTKVPPARYILKAWSQTPEGQSVRTDLLIDVTGDLNGLTLALGTAEDLLVQVRAVSSASHARRKTMIRRPPGESIAGGVRVELSSAGMTLSPVQLGASLQGSGKEQRLVVKNPEPGRYRVNIQYSGPDWYVASAQCGDIDLFRDPLEIHSGTRTPPIEVQLRNDGAQVRASMTSGGSPAAGWVLLIPARAPDQAQAMPIARDSQANFQNLAPGEYSILAVDHVDGLEYRNPDALTEYMGQASRVVLTPEQDLEVKLERVHRER